MKKLIIFNFLILSLVFNAYANDAPNSQTATEAKSQTENLVTFTPPKGWKSIPQEKLSPAVKALVVGEEKGHFPPSMCLAIEPFKGTLKDYLKIVKNINANAKTEWKDLGKIKTKAGIASLSQFDEASNFGTVRTMTTILVKNGNSYILSATALQAEFPDFYKDFFNAMSSLEIITEQ